jgi:hypothetical protein
VSRLNVDSVPQAAVNLNVSGRLVTNPMNGFGQMWQKTYRVRFEGRQVDPKEVVRVWKEKFPEFWPKNNYFYGPGGAIRPGSVAVLNLSGPNGMTAPGGAPVISTGILVIYADEESFSFMTPEGHMFAGMNTFSAYEEDGVTYAKIEALVRASDPLFELTLRLGMGHKMEDDFWRVTLRNLSGWFGAQAEPSLERTLIDSSLQWEHAKNIWHNAGVRTTFYLMSTPFRWLGRQFKGKNKPV